MKTTKPETSLSREFTATYNFSENILLEATAYKSSVLQLLMLSSGGYIEMIDVEQRLGMILL